MDSQAVYLNSFSLVDEICGLKGLGEFVLAYPSIRVQKRVLFCGSNSGRDTENKLSGCGWETMPATEVSPPLLTGCLANSECVEKEQVETGDHTTFIGEVVAAHRNAQELERLYSFADGTLGAVTRK